MTDNEKPPVATRCKTYCDRCGDCLGCYGEDACYDGGYHSWPVTESEVKDHND